MSYVAEDEIIDDNGTSLFAYLKKNYANKEDNEDVDIELYEKMINVLQELYPRDCFVEHINDADIVAISKRMMTDIDKMKVEQISNLMKYKENDDWYYSDRDKYFMKALKNIEKFDNFMKSL